MENKWQVQECGEESYAITDGKISIVTSDADNDQYLQAIADLFNSSGYRFHSENKLELDLHIEAEMAKMELGELKAKCERYEHALRDIAKQITCAEQEADEDRVVGEDGTRLGDIEVGYDCIIEVARKALSTGEGEKEVER